MYFGTSRVTPKTLSALFDVPRTWPSANLGTECRTAGTSTSSATVPGLHWTRKRRGNGGFDRLYHSIGRVCGRLTCESRNQATSDAAFCDCRKLVHGMLAQSRKLSYFCIDNIVEQFRLTNESDKFVETPTGLRQGRQNKDSIK